MNEHDDFTPDDAEIADLLRNVGARAEPSAAMTREVEAAVHAEWLAVVATRQRRRTVVWAAAASVCAVAVGAAISVQLLDHEGQPIATLQRMDGDLFVAADDGGRWTRMRPGQRIEVGAAIRSDARAALQLDSGVAVRLDRGTALKIEDDDRFALSVGAVYVDSGAGHASDGLTIDTHAGAVRHLGTQYQVRTRIDGIDVSVREGRVMVESPNGSNLASAGERLEVSTRGAVQRGRIAPTDEQWRWAGEVAPAFAIENASLAAFLDWVARETGRSLVYESARAKSVAASEILHGSIDGLAPDVALAAVLATTPLQRHETKAEVIEIGFAAPIDSNRAPRPTP